MTGLMVMFLLIAVCYMIRVEADAGRIKTVAVAYSETRDALYEDLRKGFSADLPRWNAQLIKADLTLRFSDPDILFAQGSSELKPAFKDILNDFFPRYVRILTSPKYRDAITEIRIEGHTSSDWIGGASPTTPICTTWSSLRHGRDQHCSMCWCSHRFAATSTGSVAW
jgi:outer membrane protein OmpA-like peptidoglycan-associated protein